MTMKPADELWSEYCEAATSMSNDNGVDMYDIEGMDNAAHDIYLALVTSCTERDALAAALDVMDARVEAAVRARMAKGDQP